MARSSAKANLGLKYISLLSSISFKLNPMRGGTPPRLKNWIGIIILVMLGPVIKSLALLILNRTKLIINPPKMVV